MRAQKDFISVAKNKKTIKKLDNVNVPDTNHWFFGSTATQRTQPLCPLMTR